MPDIIQINTPGPQGTTGPVGPKGEPGTLTAYEDLTVTGSLYVSGTSTDAGNITGSGINATSFTASSGLTGSVTGTLSLITFKDGGSTKQEGAIISKSFILIPSYSTNGGDDGVVQNNYPFFSFDTRTQGTNHYCSPFEFRQNISGAFFIDIGKSSYHPTPDPADLSNPLRFRIFESQSRLNPFFEVNIPLSNNYASRSLVRIGRGAANISHAQATGSLLVVDGGIYSNFLTGPNALVTLPNVSASGYLSSSKIDVNGPLTVGGNITSSGEVSASTYFGDGSNLTGIGSQPFPYTGDADIDGDVSASSYFGDGSNLTGIGSQPFPYTGDADIDGDVSASAYYGDGSNLTGVQADGFPFSGSALITGSLTVSGSEDTSISASGDISASAFHGNGQYLSGIGSVPFPYVGDAQIDGSITGSGFLSDGVGIPTLASDSNIHLEAKNGAVVITTSSLRLNSFTDAQTSSVVFSAGDIYFNSTSNNFMGYNGTSHVTLG